MAAAGSTSDLGVLITDDESQTGCGPRGSTKSKVAAIVVVTVVVAVIIIAAIMIHKQNQVNKKIYQDSWGVDEPTRPTYSDLWGVDETDTFRTLAVTPPNEKPTTPRSTSEGRTDGEGCYDAPGTRLCRTNHYCYWRKHLQKDGSCTECESPYQRKCDDGKCVDAWDWCISPQCEDLSDTKCTFPCKENQFRCDEGLLCVANSKWYDRQTDCFEDEADEHSTSSDRYSDLYDLLGQYQSDSGDSGLQHVTNDDRFDPDEGSWTCKADYKKCRTGYQCVHHTYFCDGHHDCRDESDERDCFALANTFDCGNGERIPRRQRCDGHVDCNNGQDEPLNCECLPGQWHCYNGRCIENSERCNGENECGDHSDEDACELNCGTDHLCGQNCISRGRICDGNIDCDDLSDEMNCDCSGELMFKCENGACIRNYFLCNKVDDCTDGSDEKQCANCVKEGGYLCRSNGQCLPGFVECDGEHDCPDGEDETRCDQAISPGPDTVPGSWQPPTTPTGKPTTAFPHSENCVTGQFPCSRDQCVTMVERCDGQRDCAAGRDEDGCVRLEPTSATLDADLVLVSRQGAWYPVCADNTAAIDGQTQGDYLCSTINSEYTAEKVVYKPAPTNGSYIRSPMSFALERADSSLERLPAENFQITQTCFTEKVIYAKCNTGKTSMACGTRSAGNSDEASALIIGGSEAEPGSWPWQAIILYQGEFICGGSIISDRYILTAGHCVEDSKNASLYQVKLGTTRLDDRSDHVAVYDIARVIQHELFDKETIHNDLCLLETSTAIQYTDYIRPVCLTPQNQNQLHQARCYTTGWGAYTMFNTYPNDLREMRVKVSPSHVCEEKRNEDPELYHDIKVVDEMMLCVDYEVSVTCHGDSGGPLVCRQADNTFQLIGLTSWGGFPICHTFNMFTNLTTYVPWIQEHTREGI